MPPAAEWVPTAVFPVTADSRAEAIAAFLVAIYSAAHVPAHPSARVHSIEAGRSILVGSTVSALFTHTVSGIAVMAAGADMAGATDIPITAV